MSDLDEPVSPSVASNDKTSLRRVPADALRRAKKTASKSAHKARTKMKGLKKTPSSMMRSKRGIPPPFTTSNWATANITMSGYMFKRRSGMTGLAASLFHQSDGRTEKRFGGRLWILRRFVLRNGTISYYEVDSSTMDQIHGTSELYTVKIYHGDEPIPDDELPSASSERGSIDLTRFGVQIRMSYGHSSHMTQILNGVPKDDPQSPNASSSENSESLGQEQITTAMEKEKLKKNGHGRSHTMLSQSPLDPATSKDKDTDTRSPSPYQVEILYNNMLSPKEWQSWTLCATNKRSFFKWASAITSVIYTSRGFQDDEESDEELEDVEFYERYKSESADPMDPFIQKDSEDFEEIDGVERVTRARLSTSLPSEEVTEDKNLVRVIDLFDLLKFYRLELAVALCFTNISMLALRDFEPFVYIIVLTVINLLVVWKVKSISVGKEDAWRDLILPSSLQDAVKQVSDEKITQQGVPRRISTKGTPVVRLPNRKIRGKRRDGGKTFPFKDKSEVVANHPRHCWTIPDDSVLNVRIGPDYKHNKQKAPTRPALFRTIGCDLFSSEKKLMDVGSNVNLPFDDCIPEGAIPAPYPRLLMINFQLPKPSGGVFGSTSSADGPGYNFVLYYTPTEELIQAIKDMDDGKPVEAAVPLIKRWLLEYDKDVTMKERLKLAAFILNPDECGMPSWTQGFNGKPVLIKRSGVVTIKESLQTCEIDIDLRLWGFMSRKGINSLLPSAVEKMEFIVCFLIEGQEDSELPERAMVSTHVCFLDKDKAVSLFE